MSYLSMVYVGVCGVSVSVFYMRTNLSIQSEIISIDGCYCDDIFVDIDFVTCVPQHISTILYVFATIQQDIQSHIRKRKIKTSNAYQHEIMQEIRHS